MYNAVNNTAYTNPDELEIVTLDNAVYMNLYGSKEAVERGVDECISEGILNDFLMKYREEAIEMCALEYDWEEVYQRLTRTREQMES